MGKQIQLIKYPATQVAACDVPGAKFEVDTSVSLIDYLTVSDTTSEVVLSSTDLNEHPQLLAASVAARQRFSRHSNSEGLV